MRFTLRDPFWLTLLCAALCGWALTYKAAMDFKAERDVAARAWAAAAADTKGLLEAKRP